MEKQLTTLLFAFSAIAVMAQNSPFESRPPDTITGTVPVWIIYDTKTDMPIKAYKAVEDCISYCYRVENRKNQEVNLHYGYRADSVFWKPGRYAILEDYLHPEPLTDKWLVVDTIYVVMQEHFPIADRAYTRFRLPACRAYAENFKLQVIKLPLYQRDKRSYERIAAIKRKRLGIKK